MRLDWLEEKDVMPIEFCGVHLGGNLEQTYHPTYKNEAEICYSCGS